jgi:flagellar basal-body rod modification protein FlgD
MTAPAVTSPNLASLMEPGAPLRNVSEERQDFLFLLTAQLRNQDPLDPMKPDAFAAQLAQFSSLEQLVTLNSRQESLLNSMAESTATNQAALAATLVGQEASLIMPRVTQEVRPGATLEIIVPASGTVKLTVAYADGSTRDVTLTDLRSGRQTITLPGSVRLGEATVSGTVTDEQTGTEVDIGMVGRVTIDGVRFGADGIELRVGNDLVPFAALLEFRARPAAPPAPSSPTS